ncbi:hypothetical protein [Paracoccus aminovorans]|uniref:hypothetical protein n=1 Tax=Paracoccus aminovorans TaxID=34004 RepID=UPI002B256E62|nr:hypothetical protein [Paracoccus aminovorans]
MSRDAMRRHTVDIRNVRATRTFVYDPDSDMTVPPDSRYPSRQIRRGQPAGNALFATGFITLPSATTDRISTA